MASRRLAEKVLEEHEDDLIDLPNVVALGVIADPAGGKDTDSAIIAVFVRRKQAKADLRPCERIPKFLGVGEQERVRVSVIEIGSLEP